MHHARLGCGPRQLRVLACESGFERLCGLLGRAEPEPGVALLLDPCWAVHTIGMRYSIDVVFCDSRWRVLRVVPGLRPRRIAWMRGAARVLELSANTARPLGLVTGARLQPDARFDRPDGARPTSSDGAAPFASVPMRALVGLAAVTVLAALLLGGCAATADRAPAPTSPGELRLRADIDYASRAWPLAEDAYRELLRHEPREPDHWQRLGVVFLRTGRSREAVESLQAAARLRPADARTLQNLALAHLRAAADSLEEAAALLDSPTSASAPTPSRTTIVSPAAAASLAPVSLPASASSPSPGPSAAPLRAASPLSPAHTPSAPAVPAALRGESLRSVAEAVEALLPRDLHRAPSEASR